MTGGHPPRGSPQWDSPDHCPFCGPSLSDGGIGFMDHIEGASVCRERFEAWREQIRGDIGREWGG